MAGALPGLLEAGTDFFQLFASRLPEALWIREVREDGAYAYANPSFERIFGFRPEPDDTVARVMGCVHPDDRDAANEELRRHPNGGFNCVVRFVRPDGDVRTAHVRTFSVPDEEGNPRWVAGILEDITERTRIEHALRDAESRFRGLVEQSVVAIYLLDGWKVAYANPRLCEILGFRARELQGRDLSDLVVEDDRERLRQNRGRAEDGDAAALLTTYRIRRKDGRIARLAVGGRFIEWNGRRVMLGFAHDLTERELRTEAEEKYRLLWETSTDAVILLDQEGRIEYVNPSVRAMFGYAPEELAGRGIEVLQPERLRAAHARGFRRAVETGEARIDWRRAEFAGLHRDGHEFPIEISFSRMRLGERWVFAAFMRDIAERKAAQAALEAAYERMQALSQRVLGIQEEERRAISLELHDEVGQTIAALRMTLHQLGEDVSPGQRQLVAHCQDVAANLQETVRELSLRLHPPQLEQLGLRDAVRWLAERQAAATGLGIRFSSNLPDTLRLPRATEIACFRIVQEALNNASRHARARRIEIGLERSRGRLAVSVADDGIGFDAPARRGSAPRDGGLGLMGMEQRARRGGGQLEVLSAPGRGTRVLAEFRLPRARPRSAGARR